MRRRTFLGAISAGAAGVLTGGLPKLLAAASKSEETFLLGGDLLVNRLGFGAMRLTGEGIWVGRLIARTRSKFCGVRSSWASNSSTQRRSIGCGLRLKDQRVREIFEVCILTLGHSLESFRGRTSPPQIHLPARRSRVNSLWFSSQSFWKRGSFRRGSNIGSSRRSAGVSGGSCPKVLGLLFRRERGDDLFEARIAP